MNNKNVISNYLLWILIAIPGFVMLYAFISNNSNYTNLMHASGEFAARFLILSLIATPLAILIPRAKWTNWLVKKRRYFGVATFSYTFMHTVLYLLETQLEEIGNGFLDFGLLSGWVAFFIFIPLAITSNDAAVRRLKDTWKKIQRWVYLAAILTFVHWVFIHFNWKPALVHFLPVMLLQIARVWKQGS